MRDAVELDPMELVLLGMLVLYVVGSRLPTYREAVARLRFREEREALGRDAKLGLFLMLLLVLATWTFEALLSLLGVL